MAEAPGGSSPPGVSCVNCNPGHLEVIVWKHAICWDTPLIGPENEDVPFQGARVRLQGGGRPLEGGGLGTIEPVTTGADGKAIFRNIVQGHYTIVAEKDGYTPITGRIANAESLPNLKLRHSVEVFENHTSYADIVLQLADAGENPDGTWREGRECNRRHIRPSLAFPGLNGLAGILWDREPGRLIARDLLWMAVLPLFIAIVPILSAFVFGFGEYWPLYLAGIALALWAYLTGVIWGEIAGAVAIAAGGVAYAALGIGFIFLAMGKPSCEFSQDGWKMEAALSGVFFFVLTAMWALFGIQYARGRRSDWKAPGWWLASQWFGVPAIVGALIAALSYLTFSLAMDLGEIWIPVGTVVALCIGFIFCGFAGLAASAFRNEGEQPSFGEIPELKLPFSGDRYCLQGARGYFTHHGSEEGCYDFAVPDGKEVLSAREGHILEYADGNSYRVWAPLGQHQDSHENVGDVDHKPRANYARVRHKDGSITVYSLFRKNGIAGQTWNPALGQVTLSGNALHVLQGHAIGWSGWRDHDAENGERHYADRSEWWLFGIGIAWFAVLLVVLASVAASSPGYPPSEVGVFGGADNGYCPPISRPASIDDLNTRSEALSSLSDEDKAQEENRIGCELKRLCPSEKEIEILLCSGGEPERVRLAEFCHAKEAHGYPGLYEDREGFDSQYCERLTGGLIEQPIAMMTTFAFPTLALIFLGLFCAGGENGKPQRNRMTVYWPYPLILSLILIFNGPGSALMHSTILFGWSQLDIWSMDTFVCFVFAYNVTRVSNWPFWGFLFFFAGFAITALLLALFVPTSTTPIFALLTGAAYVSQIVASLSCNVTHDKTGIALFWGGNALFVSGLVVWWLGHTGGPICSIGGAGSPDASWGHGLWHVLGASAMFMFSMFFRHQIDPEACFPRLHFATQPAPVAPPAVRPAEGAAAVKFTDPDPMLALHSKQPRSMRKYVSSNANLGKPPVNADAVFTPRGGGEHPIETA